MCLLLVRAEAKIKRNKYGATRSAGDYRRKVQLARLCALGGKDMVGEVKWKEEKTVWGGSAWAMQSVLCHVHTLGNRTRRSVAS